MEAKGAAQRSMIRAAIRHEEPETQTEQEVPMNVAEPKQRKSPNQLGVEAAKTLGRPPFITIQKR